MKDLCMSLGYRFFIAGILQGSKRGLEIHDQGYRDVIREILEKDFIDGEVYCPVQKHPDSISYDEEKARDVFFHHLEKVRKSHCLVGYLPEASMGSSIEMWEAFHEKAVIVTITPMTTNWVVSLLSDRVCADMDGFRDFVASGELEQLLRNRYPGMKRA
jgi:hypothetical protein